MKHQTSTGATKSACAVPSNKCPWRETLLHILAHKSACRQKYRSLYGSIVQSEWRACRCSCNKRRRQPGAHPDLPCSSTDLHVCGFCSLQSQDLCLTLRFRLPRASLSDTAGWPTRPSLILARKAVVISCRRLYFWMTFLIFACSESHCPTLQNDRRDLRQRLSLEAGVIVRHCRMTDATFGKDVCLSALGWCLLSSLSNWRVLTNECVGLRLRVCITLRQYSTRVWFPSDMNRAQWIV